MENKNPLKIVYKENDPLVEKIYDELKEKPLYGAELFAKLDTLGTIQEREKFIVENLKRKGLK